MMEVASLVDEVAKHLELAQDSLSCRGERRGLPARSNGRFWKSELLEVGESARADRAQRGEYVSSKADTKAKRGRL